MKVKELIKELQKINGEFEVVMTHSWTSDDGGWGYNIDTYHIKGICDIGYSSKVVSLDGEKDG